MKGVVEILEALYVDALTDASANYAAGAQKNTAGGGVKYQARPFQESVGASGRLGHGWRIIP